MSAAEVINQFKRLPPDEQAQVARFVVQNEKQVAQSKVVVAIGGDSLPIIRANGGIITSRLVSELEALTP